MGLAHKSFKESYQKSQSNNSFHHFEFWIGGYDFQIQNGEIWKFEIQQGKFNQPLQLVSSQVPDQILRGGQGQAISRLLLGHDPLIPQTFKLGPSQFSNFQTPLVHSTMPLQDAIESHRLALMEGGLDGMRDEGLTCGALGTSLPWLSPLDILQPWYMDHNQSWLR